MEAAGPGKQVTGWKLGEKEATDDRLGIMMGCFVRMKIKALSFKSKKARKAPTRFIPTPLVIPVNVRSSVDDQVLGKICPERLLEDLAGPEVEVFK